MPGIAVGHHRPDRNEKRRDQRTDDETVDTHERDTAERRYQDQIVRHAGAFADERRPQQIVDEADDQYSRREQNEPFPEIFFLNQKLAELVRPDVSIDFPFADG